MSLPFIITPYLSLHLLQWGPLKEQHLLNKSSTLYQQYKKEKANNLLIGIVHLPPIKSQRAKLVLRWLGTAGFSLFREESASFLLRE